MISSRRTPGVLTRTRARGVLHERGSGSLSSICWPAQSPQGTLGGAASTHALARRRRRLQHKPPRCSPRPDIRTPGLPSRFRRGLLGFAERGTRVGKPSPKSTARQGFAPHRGRVGNAQRDATGTRHRRSALSPAFAVVPAKVVIVRISHASATSPARLPPRRIGRSNEPNRGDAGPSLRRGLPDGNRRMPFLNDRCELRRGRYQTRSYSSSIADVPAHPREKQPS